MSSTSVPLLLGNEKVTLVYKKSIEGKNSEVVYYFSAL
jgi:hypothetical protein